MAKNKVARPRTAPREFVVVVGAPSNTFNGYVQLKPGTNEDEPRPKPHTLGELANYLPPNPNPNFVGTHDLYWANFVDPVHRLFRLGIAQPEPGDLVTVAVFFKPYELRADADWNASPYNMLAWRNSPWVRGKEPYDPLIFASSQGVAKAPQKPTSRKADPKFKSEPVSDARIDHEILMRTTKEDDSTAALKRPRRPSHWIDLLHDIPRRVVMGNPQLIADPPALPRVLVKLILIRDLAELLGYLATGNWAGERAIHLLDTHDEEDMANGGIHEDSTYDYHALGKVPQHALKFWKQVPVVDRKHVKIQRLDYFGHSNEDSWFLRYGWGNDKGEMPVGEVTVDASMLLDQTFAFGPKPHFAPDAVCQMWGCSLGTPGRMAEQLSKLIPEVIASNDLSTYEHIADSDSTMPEPIPGGSFVTFKKAP